MIAKEILKEVVVKMGLLLIVMQVLKHVYVSNIVQLTRCVKRDIAACIV